MLQIDLSAVEFDPDVLALHYIKTLMLLAEERLKYHPDATVGEPFALLLDDENLTIIVPVYCCRAHMEDGEDPFACIITDKIPVPCWQFKRGLGTVFSLTPSGKFYMTYC